MWEKGGTADAHDAGRGCGLCEIGGPLTLMMLGVGAASGKKEARLMLMMLGWGAACGKNGPADAHDAWRGRGLWEKGGPADAHDAGWAWLLAKRMHG